MQNVKVYFVNWGLKVMEYSEGSIPLSSRIFILEGRFSCQCIDEYKELKLPFAIQKYNDRLDEEWKNAIFQYLKM